MSPSSPVSVGIYPSNRTLEVGDVQVDMIPSPSGIVEKVEQCPVTDDPLAGITVAGKR